MIAPVRCRWLRLQGEAARILGSQKSRRFCRIAKSPTSFDPASIASGCRQPLMSAPASVPRVARPSEATTFARSAYITDFIFFILFAISTVANSALLKVLPPQQSDRPGGDVGSTFGSISCVSFWCPMQGVFPVAYAVVSFREPQQVLLLGIDAVVSSRMQMSSIFMKFTWHANPHYRYL